MLDLVKSGELFRQPPFDAKPHRSSAASTTSPSPVMANRQATRNSSKSANSRRACFSRHVCWIRSWLSSPTPHYSTNPRARAHANSSTTTTAKSGPSSTPAREDYYLSRRADEHSLCAGVLDNILAAGRDSARSSFSLCSWKVHDQPPPDVEIDEFVQPPPSSFATPAAGSSLRAGLHGRARHGRELRGPAGQIPRRRDRRNGARHRPSRRTLLRPRLIRYRCDHPGSSSACRYAARPSRQPRICFPVACAYFEVSRTLNAGRTAELGRWRFHSADVVRERSAFNPNSSRIAAVKSCQFVCPALTR